MDNIIDFTQPNQETDDGRRVWTITHYVSEDTTNTREFVGYMHLDPTTSMVGFISEKDTAAVDLMLPLGSILEVSSGPVTNVEVH